MCNNIRINQLKKVNREEIVKDKISDWLESRPELARKNIKAIEKRNLNDESIVYVSGFPLKLNDGTKVRKITSRKIDNQHKEISVEYNYRGEKKTGVAYFKRYLNDSLEQIEEFIGNSQSIFQTRNIDLNYK
ncbi:MAG: hypothetical protein ACI4ON_01190 [Clostridia bacterium]